MLRLLEKGLITTALLAIAGSVIATTCPTDIKRSHQGYWYSDTAPGWKSHRSTKNGITVSAKDFGGVVYSPTRKRMACVYRASNGKWVALVSNVHHGITIDKNVKDNSGKAPAWKYSKKHKDYACGRPSVTKLSDCSFELK